MNAQIGIMFISIPDVYYKNVLNEINKLIN